MKILFVHEPFQVEPLGIAYLAAALKKRGHEVDLSHTHDALDTLKSFKPQAVAFSTTTGKHKKYLELNRTLKQHAPVLSIFGGSHPTYFPKMISEPGVDAIIRGEAEKSFCEFLDELQTKKKAKRIVDFRTLEQNLDRIAFPDRDFLYKYKENRDNPIKNVITSRGCRFSCPYCFNSIYREFYKGQNWLRFRSADNVIKECKSLLKYPLKMIFFQDDEFLSNPHFGEILDRYAAEVHVPFHCQLRIELLTEDKARHLKSSGCTGVTFAIESGCDKIRHEVLLRKMTREQILKGVKILKDYGLKFRTENMVGLPDETLEQMLETLDLNIKCKPTIAWASIFQPYPRLPLSGGYWGKANDFAESFFENTVLKGPLKKKIVNLQRLFALICSYPVLRPFVKVLILVRPNRLYDWIYKIWKNNRYAVLFR